MTPPSSTDVTPSDDDRRRFEAEGFLVLPGFYDRARDIEPIQRAIHALIGLLLEKYRLDVRRDPFRPEAFDDGLPALLAHDRRVGGELYDAVKQIPAFVRLVGDARHEALVARLRSTDLVGIAAGGSGIRIDHPNEDRFRAPWHQEYPAQLRSLDGVVLWSPLVPVDAALGPVRLCVGSHRDGPRPVQRHDPRHPERSGSYALVLADEADLVAQYEQVAPLTAPGDLVIIDFLTLHASGRNASDRSRWSMQFRYFNFREPTGRGHGWKGSFAAGVDFATVHPELVVDPGVPAAV